MGKRRNDEEYCPLYTTVARCRRTDHYCFNCGQGPEQKASSEDE